ncbi:4'-phosphopantetheinyl transferase family protein [Rheinheimera sp. WS51]|uniref:4'-phosphopantetheinyl transferase family protein n=1 Tax=Rheinheimera sp. WS51 TaxID=3425886 RepID=UPI003D91F193
MAVQAIIHQSPILLDLTPAPLIAHCCFNIKEYNDSLFQNYNIEMPAELSQAVTKRRCEYLAGRVLFQHLLKQYRLPCTQLLNSLDGAPSWPVGYVGSISHADGNAICCLMPENVYAAVGIDIESILSPESVSELAPHILQPEEQRLLSSNTCLDDAELLTIAFSAKESLYKALYPQVKRFFGFEAATIKNIMPSKQTFILSLNTELTPQLTMGSEFYGHYCFINKQVITLIVLPTN